MSTFIVGTLVLGAFVLLDVKFIKTRKMEIVVVEAEIAVTAMAHVNLVD